MENTYVVKELKGIDPALEQYKALVLATWLNSLKHGSDFFGLVDSHTFFDVYRRVILGILRRPDCVVRLAVLGDEPDTALGWCVFEKNVLHFVYVRPGEKGASSRRCGIGQSLLPKSFDVATHMTKIGKSIWKKKFSTVKFNPF